MVDQFEAGHVRGSSHGAARIFRLGYPIDASAYTELALETHTLSRELEHESGCRILDPVGALDAGPAAELESVSRSYERCSVPCEVLSPDAASRRWQGGREAPQMFRASWPAPPATRAHS